MLKKWVENLFNNKKSQEEASVETKQSKKPNYSMEEIKKITGAEDYKRPLTEFALRDDEDDLIGIERDEMEQKIHKLNGYITKAEQRVTFLNKELEKIYQAEDPVELEKGLRAYELRTKYESEV